MNYCSNCGAKVYPNASFCHSCGSKIAGGATAFTEDKTNVKHQKSRFLAGILALLLGTMGIHNFYLGYNKKGIAQLLMFVFYLGWVSCIWGIVEGIMIFTDKINRDAKGNPLAETF